MPLVVHRELPIELCWALEVALQMVADLPVKPMNPSLREQVWRDLYLELSKAGLRLEVALPLYANWKAGLNPTSPPDSEEEEI